MKYLLLLLPLTAFAGGNHHEHVTNVTVNPIVKETVIEKTTIKETFIDEQAIQNINDEFNARTAASIAIAGIPSLSQDSTNKSAVGFGFGGSVNHVGVAVGIENHVENKAFKAAVAKASGSEAVFNLGMSISF